MILQNLNPANMSLANTTTPRILIVDDEPAIASAVQFSLQQQGYASDIAHWGEQALGMLELQSYALAILDIGLPDMDGFELCKRMQQKFAIPVIFLTARNDEIDRVVGLEIGADDYVCKPFSPRELMARVKIVIKRHTPTSTTPEKTLQLQRYEEFEWEEAARTVQWKNQLLQLTRYEYDILLMLLKNPRRIYSRDDIMTHVWVAPEHSVDRTVDTHIKTLRAKLRAIDATAEVIITHRGLGYSLAQGTRR